MKKNRSARAKKLHFFWIAATLLILFSFLCKGAFGTTYDLLNLKSNIECIVPLVVLEDGVNNTSTIYTNSTSARINIDAISTPSTFNYSLNIVNNGANIEEVRLECFGSENVDLVNATMLLHDNVTSSTQITISGGTVNQTNEYYNLTGNATIHLGIQDLVESEEGSTILHVYLRIKTLNTSIHDRYVITFEFT